MGHFSQRIGEVILERKKYPPTYYNPLVRRAFSKINENPDQGEEACSRPIDSKRTKSCLILQYSGKVSDKMSRKVKGISQDINIVFTTCKMKLVLPRSRSKSRRITVVVLSIKSSVKAARLVTSARQVDISKHE